MAHLTEKQKKAICEMINNWPLNGKLTWPNIVKAVKARFDLEFTRQTLSSHNAIALAYSARKELMSQNKYRGHVPKSMSFQTALETVEKLKGQMALLKAENLALKQQFARWAHNAKNRGLSFDYLNQNLSPAAETKEDEHEY